MIGLGSDKKKILGDGWSKSNVLENEVFLNFDVRHGAKKSGHLDHLFQSICQIFFNIFRYISRESGLPPARSKAKFIFINDMH